MRTVKQGDTVPVPLLVVEAGTNDAVDLSGSTVTAQAAPQGGGSTESLSATITDASAGRVSIVTASLPPGFYNVELTFTGPQGVQTAPTGHYLPVRVLAKV